MRKKREQSSAFRVQIILSINMENLIIADDTI